MVGERVNDETKHLLDKEIQLGCELGNHTYSHNHYGSQVTASDISKASKQIEKISGKAPTMFRCPGGSITPAIRKECKKRGCPLLIGRLILKIGVLKMRARFIRILPSMLMTAQSF